MVESPRTPGGHHALWSAAGDYDAGAEPVRGVPEAAASALMAFGPPFARERSFWICTALSGVTGIVMSAVGFTFFYLYESLSEVLWQTEEYKERLRQITPGNGVGLGEGDWRWVALGASAGLAVSLVKTVYGLLVVPVPFNLKGTLFTHIKDLELHDWRETPCIFLVAMISLGAGCSLGPEAPLGICGATVSYIVLRTYRRCVGRGNVDSDSERSQTEDDEVGLDALNDLDLRLGEDEKENKQMEKLSIRSGIASAMGAVFPSPLIAVVMVHELEQVIADYRHAVVERAMKLTFMEGVVHAAVASSVSWFVCSLMKEFTFLKPEPLPIGQGFVHFKYKMVFASILIGTVGAVVGLLGFILNLIAKVGFTKLRLSLNDFGRRFGLSHAVCLLGDVLIPVLGGTLFGLLAVACPLSIGDGNMQMPYLITLGSGYGHTTLLVTAIAKLLALSICNATGFIGGPIFPLVFAGSCAGRACVDLFPEAFDDTNLTMLFVPCMSVAVGCSYTPLVLTMTTMVTVSFVLGAEWATLLFISGCTAFLVGCGFGAVQMFIVGRGQIGKRS
eukprot:TRINITY_DN18626_c0_g1_i1.p1 TRINITY_DN18626_c0_g1~~TRINITY_DN18626_c0_g1_i1.p1  ORF type:complete len:560 (-),score=100.45 TRINITY_DN18626_c0_g1_i1:206-1885(-)